MTEEYLSSIKILNQDFRLFKDAFEFPELYLSNHFIELRRKVDLAYAKLESSLQETVKIEALKVNWQATVEKINSYETDCLQKVKKRDNLNEDLKTKILDSFQSIEARLKSFAKNDLSSLN
jgi:hypothetical protein